MTELPQTDVVSINITTALLVVGDSHGSFKRLRIESAPQHSVFIHIGDFGIGDFGDRGVSAMRRIRELDLRLTQHQSTMYVIRGNHDDPQYFKTVQQVDGCENITLIPDFSHGILNYGSTTVKCVFIGGAHSIDRIHRTENVSWWRDEVPQFGEYGHTIDWCADGDKVVVFAHEVPHSFAGYVHEMCDPEFLKLFTSRDKTLADDLAKLQVELSGFMSDMRLGTRGKDLMWVHGHYHYSGTHIEPNLRIYGLNINEIKDLTNTLFPLQTS